MQYFIIKIKNGEKFISNKRKMRSNILLIRNYFMVFAII